jgi:hypothetical protein
MLSGVLKHTRCFGAPAVSCIAVLKPPHLATSLQASSRVPARWHGRLGAGGAGGMADWQLRSLSTRTAASATLVAPRAQPSQTQSLLRVWHRANQPSQTQSLLRVWHRANQPSQTQPLSAWQGAAQEPLPQPLSAALLTTPHSTVHGTATTPHAPLSMQRQQQQQHEDCNADRCDGLALLLVTPAPSPARLHVLRQTAPWAGPWERGTLNSKDRATKQHLAATTCNLKAPAKAATHCLPIGICCQSRQCPRKPASLQACKPASLHRQHCPVAVPTFHNAVEGDPFLQHVP